MRRPTISRYTKLIPTIGATAVLLLAACGGDDGGENPYGLGVGDVPELETSVPEDAAADLSGSGADAPAAGGDAQAFCDWFTSVGPVPDDWTMEDMPAPPAEIADAFDAILAGDTDLSLQSEVTNWVTENCF